MRLASMLTACSRSAGRAAMSLVAVPRELATSAAKGSRWGLSRGNSSRQAMVSRSTREAGGTLSDSSRLFSGDGAFSRAMADIAGRLGNWMKLAVTDNAATTTRKLTTVLFWRSVLIQAEEVQF